ncbi:hypothetical protein FQN57_005511 [Myotisia sp. PD_48]|nr:hypothetical protein FQN57_005511 [Myotisia sp. PD_48]
MICRQCRIGLLSRLALPRKPATTVAPPTCSSLTSHTYSPSYSRLYSSETVSASFSTPASERKRVSSVPGGTALRGLNYFKNKVDPIALEDHEYPDWLWTLLDQPTKNVKLGGDVDVSAMNKKERKKHVKKMAALRAAQPHVIPLHEQAIDITPASYNLPAAGEGSETTMAASSTGEDITLATASVTAISEITKSARDARRKEIKESNFLRGM